MPKPANLRSKKELLMYDVYFLFCLFVCLCVIVVVVVVVVVVFNSVIINLNVIDVQIFQKKRYSPKLKNASNFFGPPRRGPRKNKNCETKERVQAIPKNSVKIFLIYT